MILEGELYVFRNFIPSFHMVILQSFTMSHEADRQTDRQTAEFGLLVEVTRSKSESCSLTRQVASLPAALF